MEADLPDTSEEKIRSLISQGRSKIEDAIQRHNLTPEPSSRWFNNRRQKIYTVIGVVSHCEGEDDWEVLYRSDDMPPNHYRRRSVASWYGTNRDGLPRFVDVRDLSSN